MLDYSNALSAINIKQELDEKQQDVLGVLEDYLNVNAGEEFAMMYRIHQLYIQIPVKIDYAC